MHFTFFLILLSSVYSDTAQNDNPFSIYDELWKVFDDQYAGFESRNIDWKSLKPANDLKLRESLSETALFEECCGLLSVLNDAHVSLTAEINGERKVCNAFDFPKATNLYKRYGNDTSFFKVVDRTLVANDFEVPTAVSNKVSYTFDNGIGYIRINDFMKSWKDFEVAYEICIGSNPPSF